MLLNKFHLWIMLLGSSLIAPINSPAAEIRTFTLSTGDQTYFGASGDIKNIKNPTIKVKKGDKVVITLINNNSEMHDIALDSQLAKSKMLKQTGDRDTISFPAIGNDYYYCTVSGHRLAGMEGKIEVSEN